MGHSSGVVIAGSIADSRAGSLFFSVAISVRGNAARATPLAIARFAIAAGRSYFLQRFAIPPDAPLSGMTSSAVMIIFMYSAMVNFFFILINRWGVIISHAK
jgi:hypothetical protein